MYQNKSILNQLYFVQRKKHLVKVLSILQIFNELNLVIFIYKQRNQASYSVVHPQQSITYATFLRHFSSLSVLKPPSCLPRPLNHLFDVQTSSNHTHAPSNNKTTTFQYHFQKINTASIFFLPSKLRLFP